MTSGCLTKMKFPYIRRYLNSNSVTNTNHEQTLTAPMRLLRARLQKPRNSPKTPPSMHHVVMQLPARPTIHHVPQRVTPPHRSNMLLLQRTARQILRRQSQRHPLERTHGATQLPRLHPNTLLLRPALPATPTRFPSRIVRQHTLRRLDSPPEIQPAENALALRPRGTQNPRPPLHRDTQPRSKQYQRRHKE